MSDRQVPAEPGRTSDYVTLAKPRLNMLVIATTLAGYYMAAPRHAGWMLLFHTLVGTALVASGASAFNQLLEIEADGLMRRTRARPLPSGRMEPRHARIFGVVLSIAGLVQLALGVNLLAAGVALVTLLTYTVFYTPLKKRSSLATVVGGIPGALPPMIGWAAVRNNLSLEAWILFGIVFLWQMPHFLAIAWMYREDYKRAGFPLLPIVEPDGGSTGRQALIYAAALVPLSLAPTAMSMAGNVYLVGASILSLAFVLLAARFAWRRTTSTARWLFFGSITYLPLLWMLMAFNRVAT
ncbi:MAG: heme o synthase [Acidobacteria bacterium]|nr:heme o synthase [Acidobacteriota bacterium]